MESSWELFRDCEWKARYSVLAVISIGPQNCLPISKIPGLCFLALHYGSINSSFLTSARETRRSDHDGEVMIPRCLPSPALLCLQQRCSWICCPQAILIVQFHLSAFSVRCMLRTRPRPHRYLVTVTGLSICCVSLPTRSRVMIMITSGHSNV